MRKYLDILEEAAGDRRVISESEIDSLVEDFRSFVREAAANPSDKAALWENFLRGFRRHPLAAGLGAGAALAGALALASADADGPPPGFEYPEPDSYEHPEGFAPPDNFAYDDEEDRYVPYPEEFPGTNRSYDDEPINEWFDRKEPKVGDTVNPGLAFISAMSAGFNDDFINSFKNAPIIDVIRKHGKEWIVELDVKGGWEAAISWNPVTRSWAIQAVQ